MKFTDMAKIEIEDAEGAFTQHDLLDEIAALVDRLGTRTLTARHLQISLPYLSDVMLGRRIISSNLAEKLGFRKVTLFLKDGPKSKER